MLGPMVVLGAAAAVATGQITQIKFDYIYTVQKQWKIVNCCV